jgi:hypothetical protein
MKALLAVVVAIMLAGCGGGGGGESTAQNDVPDIPWDDVNWENIGPKPIEWCLEKDAYGNYWKVACSK